MDDSELETSDEILTPNTDVAERSTWTHNVVSKGKHKRFRVLKDVRFYFISFAFYKIIEMKIQLIYLQHEMISRFVSELLMVGPKKQRQKVR